MLLCICKIYPTAEKYVFTPDDHYTEEYSHLETNHKVGIFWL